MEDKLSIILRCLLTLIIAVILPACQEGPSTGVMPDQPLFSTKPLISVGERRLSLEQFNRHLRLHYPDIDALSAQEKFLLQRQLITQLVDRELILAEAARLDIRLSPDEFDDALADIKPPLGQMDTEQNLQEPRQTPDLWRDVLTFQLLVAKLTESIVAPQIDISEATLEDYYRNHRENFRRPAEVRVHQMLFNNKEDALEIKKLLQDGADFATLAREHSLSLDREDGGNLGYFSAGQLPPEFDDVIFKLPLRQVSRPVASPYGFHLLMVDQRRNAGLRPFPAVRDEIRSYLYDKQEEILFQQWISALRSNAAVRIDWQQILPQQPSTR